MHKKEKHILHKYLLNHGFYLCRSLRYGPLKTKN